MDLGAGSLPECQQNVVESAFLIGGLTLSRTLIGNPGKEQRLPRLAEPKPSLFPAASLRCCGQRQHSPQSGASAGSAFDMSQNSLTVMCLMCS